MEQTINIADLVKPKFKVGQDVFVVTRDYRRYVETIYPKRISSIEFGVVITTEKAGGPETRQTRLIYHTGSSGHGYFESDLFASLDDLPAEDRKPR